MKFIRLPRSVVRPCRAWDVVQKVGDAAHVSSAGPWIAGGSVRRALRNEKLSDVDLFVANPAQAARLRDGTDFTPADVTTELATSHWFNGFMPAVRTQVVTITVAPTLEEVLTAFDFNEAALGYDGHELVLSEEGLLGLLRGHLSINKECRGQFPGVTAWRIVKYSEAGLKPCAGTLVDLLQLAGVDTSRLERKYVD